MVYFAAQGAFCDCDITHLVFVAATSRDCKLFFHSYVRQIFTFLIWGDHSPEIDYIFISGWKRWRLLNSSTFVFALLQYPIWLTANVCLFARLNTCKQPASLHVHTDFLVGIGVGVQRERQDGALAFHPTNPRGMFGVPARMKPPPLREFSVEIHQNAVLFVSLKAHLCCSLCSSAVICSEGF